MPVEEIIVDFEPGLNKPATDARSTLITTSIQAVRARGRFDEYARALPDKWRDTIVTAVAGMWLPMDIASAHYAACDTLGFSAQEQFAIGREVGQRVQGTVLGLFVRTARTAGATPWAGLTQCRLLYGRLFHGGNVKLTKLGPKEARVEVVNNRLFAHAHFRNGFRGLTCAGGELFSQKVYAHELPKYTSATNFGIRVSWA